MNPLKRWWGRAVGGPLKLENPTFGQQRRPARFSSQQAPFVQESRAQATMPTRPSFVPDKNVLATLRRSRPIIDSVRKTFGGEGNLALSILLAENTGLNPRQKQIGGGPAQGLWQFEPPTWKDMRGGDVNDPSESTRTAKKLRDKRGWGQWSAYNNGAYKKYEPYAELTDY